MDRMILRIARRSQTECNIPRWCISDVMGALRLQRNLTGLGEWYWDMNELCGDWWCSLDPSWALRNLFKLEGDHCMSTELKEAHQLLLFLLINLLGNYI